MKKKRKVMFNTSLSEGDIIRVRLFMGEVDFQVIRDRDSGELVATTTNGDVEFFVNNLSHTSRAFQRGSKWEYLGRVERDSNPYIEDVDFEEFDEPIIFLLDEPIKQNDATDGPAVS
jgi:hypothetical protein